jgi:hypothetical protein
MTIKLDIFCGLGMLFIALKLTYFIAWSWWWVLAPFWIPLLLIIVFMVILPGIILIIDHFINGI